MQTTIKAIFEDGNYLVSTINGTFEDAAEYYVGQYFEIQEEKPLVRCVKIEAIQ